MDTPRADTPPDSRKKSSEKPGNERKKSSEKPGNERKKSSEKPGNERKAPECDMEREYKLRKFKSYLVFSAFLTYLSLIVIAALFLRQDEREKAGDAPKHHVTIQFGGIFIFIAFLVAVWSIESM